MTELTKRLTPHHHVVIGKVPDEKSIRCFGRDFDVRRYLARFDTCECLAHELARTWYGITGDSWIVHTVPVVGGEGAGGYMAGYLGKKFMSDERQELLGMSRRWSSSHGWPGSGKLKFKQTEEGGWAERQFRKGHVDEGILGGPADLMIRVGENITLKKAETGKVKSLLRQGGVH